MFIQVYFVTVLMQTAERSIKLVEQVVTIVERIFSEAGEKASQMTDQRLGRTRQGATLDSLSQVTNA